MNALSLGPHPRPEYQRLAACNRKDSCQSLVLSSFVLMHRLFLEPGSISLCMDA